MLRHRIGGIAWHIGNLDAMGVCIPKIYVVGSRSCLGNEFQIFRLL